MRYVHIALVVLVTAAVLRFKVQNLSSVTVSFLSLSATLPVSLIADAKALLDAGTINADEFARLKAKALA